MMERWRVRWRRRESVTLHSAELGRKKRTESILREGKEEMFTPKPGSVKLN